LASILALLLQEGGAGGVACLPTCSPRTLGSVLPLHFVYNILTRKSSAETTAFFAVIKYIYYYRQHPFLPGTRTDEDKIYSTIYH
jgi:hypothetical protein